MNYSEFQSTLVSRLNSLTSPGVTVQIHMIPKNNSTDRIGLVLMDENEQEQRVSPIAYPDQLYYAYTRGASMEEVTEAAWRILHFPIPPEVDLRYLEDPDYVLSHVVLRLIGKERNAECLNAAWSCDFLDLAVLLCILVKDSEDTFASAVITRELYQELGLPEGELLRRARENSALFLNERIRNLDHMVTDPGSSSEVDPAHPGPPDARIYILTNTQHHYGATAVLYSEKMKQLARSLGSDLLILPSSVHEVILMQDTGEHDLDSLRAFIRDVNLSELRPEDILSEQVYRYSLEKDRVELA